MWNFFQLKAVAEMRRRRRREGDEAAGVEHGQRLCEKKVTFFFIKLHHCQLNFSKVAIHFHCLNLWFLIVLIDQPLGMPRMDEEVSLTFSIKG